MADDDKRLEKEKKGRDKREWRNKEKRYKYKETKKTKRRSADMKK